ncbi:MAG: hypothetical protein LGR52_14775 [Candidatus Thiosymbion ectosymbiont of Robbea hypermnestra]|nr:hypothetical protein [Candidatus Thiosymbion ectosymbiont of Robbea hypermnestra]
MGQRIIFNEPSGGSWLHEMTRDVEGISRFLGEFSKGMGLPPVKYDPSRISRVVFNLHQDFPHPSGIKGASIFKKVSFFVINFIIKKPILESFPAELIGNELSGIPNHENVIFAFHIAIESLYKAKIIRGTGEKLILENRIEVSEHSYREIIEALSEISQLTHNFKLLCVFFEQLAYKTNPHCQYPPIDI